MRIERRLVAPHLGDPDQPRVEHVPRIGIFETAVLGTAARDHTLHVRPCLLEPVGRQTDRADDQEHGSSFLRDVGSSHFPTLAQAWPATLAGLSYARQPMVRGLQWRSAKASSPARWP